MYIVWALVCVCMSHILTKFLKQQKWNFYIISPLLKFAVSRLLQKQKALRKLISLLSNPWCVIWMLSNVKK